MTIKERIKEYCEVKNIAVSRFEHNAGISNGYFNNIKKRPSPTVIEKIDRAFPDLNPAWLLTGEGDMLRNSGDVPTGGDENFRLVPMYNIDARGGFGTNDEVDVAQYIVDYIPFKDAKADDICVPIVGNSMAPTYCAGAIVLLHKIEQWREFLELGQVYMIALTDGRRIIKELRRSEEDRQANYLCVSHNPDFDPVELPKKMIEAVFLVKAVYAKTSM